MLRMLRAMVAGTFFSWWNNLLNESLETFVKSCIAKHWSKMIACETVIAKLRLNEWASNILWIRCKGNQNFITCHLSSGIDRVHGTIDIGPLQGTCNHLITWFSCLSADRFQFDPRSTFFFRDLPSEYTSVSAAAEVSKMARKDSASLDLTNHHRGPHETGGSSGGPPGSRSAFRAVHQGESFLAPTSEGSYMS